VDYLVRIAVISDIHSNFEALTAVINDIKENHTDINDIFCLGDIVGYGPDPDDCVNYLFRNSEFRISMVKGNHDHYVAQASIPPQVNSTAKEAIEYQITRTSLENRLELSNLPLVKSITRSQFGIDIFLVHGSPQHPLSKYIYPNSKELPQLFAYLENTGTDILILGHTHIPAVERVETDEKQLLILNPGSVGQPRDRNPKSSYAILDSNLEVEIVRVDYDIESVMNKICRNGLPISLAHRLRKGL